MARGTLPAQMRRGLPWRIDPIAIVEARSLHRRFEDAEASGTVALRPDPRRKQMSTTDDLLKNNVSFAQSFGKGDLPLPPAKKIAIVACMDARLNPYPILGLELGDAHVIRNAGGVITDDEIRSLAISQHLLGTEEIMLIHHTDCGMLTFNDQEFADKLEAETGQRPQWEARSFPDLGQDVRDSIQRIKDSPFIPNTDSVRGFIYDTKSGELREAT
jgi:carbonic anhydrase